MGEFHDAVIRLLGAFSCGISMIKAQQRTDETKPDPKAEKRLSKSLKKNRLEVENAYDQDLVRFGPSFANGDAEAHSSLSKILYRLNAIIKRFTSGKSATTDYQALLNLSNSSRIEAISTFEQLSQRLSRSSLALVPLSPGPREMRQHQHKRQKKSGSKHSRSKSAPELSVTPLGFVRPKAGRKRSSDSSKSSKTSGTAIPKRKTARTSKSQSPQPTLSPGQSTPPRQTESIEYTPPPQYTSSPEPVEKRTANRKSFMSFASDSTKIGEIPEHKWVQSAAMQANKSPITIYYPVQPYQEPEKQRSRLMKLFRR